MSAIQIKLIDVPNREGRFNLPQKQFYTLLIEAFEEYIKSSNHPEDKKLFLNSLTLARFVCYGTLNAFYRCYVPPGFKNTNIRIRRELTKLALNQHGKYYSLPEPTKLLKQLKELIK